MQLFVLLIGPSGVGKSTIIRELIQNDKRFVYVTPYTDRPVRPGETDKITVSAETFDTMLLENKFAVVNNHFNHRYGTPREAITTILSQDKIPILDMMLTGAKLFAEYNTILFRIYIAPPSITALEERLIKAHRSDRFEHGKKEIELLVQNHYKHKDVDVVVVNDDISSATRRVRVLVEEKLQ